jgi:colicin import membrane protein
VALLGQWSFSPKPKATPLTIQAKIVEPISAVSIDKKKLTEHVERIKQEQALAKAKEEARVKALEQRAIEAEKARQREQQRLTNLEKEKKRKENEKRQAELAAEQAKQAAEKARAIAKEAEQLRLKKEAEKQQAEKAAELAKQKRLAEEEAAKKAQALREKQEAERRRKEQEAKERQLQQQLLEQQLAAEMEERQKARAQQIQSEISRYTALISQTIQRNLITDRSTMEGKSCKLTISLAPSGFVINVVANEGDRIVCEAAQKAIYRAGTLPVSSDPEIFKEMSRISLTVIPEFN